MGNAVIKRITKINDGTKGVCRIEVVIIGILLFVSAFFFCFMHDFSLTLQQSLIFNDCLFHGKLNQFYSVVSKKAMAGGFGADWPASLLGGANYSIINYASYGIVCMPLYLIGKVFHITIPFLLYETVIKILYVAINLYSGKICYDICLTLGFDKVKSQWVSFCFLSAPILLFSSTMITHLDIFSLLFLMLGMRDMFHKKTTRMLIFFMIAVAYKPFVLLCIIPIILLQEKRILVILGKMLVILSGNLLQSIIYSFDAAYGETQEYMSAAYDFMGKFFAVGYTYDLNMFQASVSYFVIAFVVICFIAYRFKCKKSSFAYFALPLLVWCFFIMFVKWHPNWLIFIVPFMAFLVGYVSDVKLACLLDGVLSIFTIINVSLGWQGFYDNNMIGSGGISKLLGLSPNAEYTLGNIIVNKLNKVPTQLYSSILSAVAICIIINTILELRRDMTRTSDTVMETAWKRDMLWFRVLPIVIFIIYSFMSCFL